MEDSVIKSWAAYIRDDLPRMKGQIQISDTEIIIPRVPERLRLGENDPYDPQIISFGPYHHGKPSLQAMEKFKWRYLEAILCRNEEIPLEHYIKMMMEQEWKIRSWYPDYFDIDRSIEFVKMVLLDSCFVVEYLLRCHEDVLDELDSMDRMHDHIQYDILLLENQIPFFILNKIFELLQVTPSPPMDAHSNPSSFTGLAISYLNRVTEQKCNLPPPESVHHLLHLYHSSCLYTPEVEGDSTTNIITIDGVTSAISAQVSNREIPSATVLLEAGIKFMRKEVEGSSLDVTFSNGKMEIPPLLINAHTKSRLRNLVIFEQFYPNFRSDKSFSAYVEFINCLVATPEDVALLYQEGIIQTYYSNEYTAGLLSQLKRGTSVKSNHYLAPLYLEVNKHWQNIEFIAASSIRANLSLIKDQISDTGIIIPRVPERLRLGENDAYEPRIISFGPYHCRGEKLYATRRYKLSYLQGILSRDPMIPLDMYVNMVGSMMDKIKCCYPDYFDLKDPDLIKIMVIDGCFIVEYLLRVHEGVKDELNSMVLIQLLKYDILLLENQLPFFILDKIYELAITPPSSNSYPPSFTDLAIGYFNWVFQKKINLPPPLPPPETVHHLLHLYHLFCLYTPRVEEGASDGTIISNIDTPSLTSHKDSSIMIPGATLLQEAGIRFKVKEVEGCSLDVTFDGGQGQMVIPRLFIDSSTKSKLRNLIAFEQFYPNYESKFSKSFSVYCSFMNDIINTPEDVALLCEKDIIHHSLGSNDEVAHIFNHLNGGAIIAQSHYLNDIYKKLLEAFSWFLPFSKPTSLATLLIHLLLINELISLQYFYENQKIPSKKRREEIKRRRFLNIKSVLSSDVWLRQRSDCRC
ncbi:UPF0481 protein [Cinnamomum micranthum f. kanehirae]|uniref:UPF0481 protein n=1 Tax=Cinnamomum micranthum f. kanehirae TaxID=337451 RepID=A0A3S3N6W8_9MAGN|nr:UPF0481 protein [Cinnamomum micranthum f. kanehirae]